MRAYIAPAHALLLAPVILYIELLFLQLPGGY